MSESATTISVNTEDLMKCRYHKKQKIQFYCQEDELSLCAICAEQHSDHTLDNLKDKCGTLFKPWMDIRNQLSRVRNVILAHKEAFPEESFNKFIERQEKFNIKYLKLTELKNHLQLQQLMGMQHLCQRYKDKVYIYGKNMAMATLGKQLFSNKAAKELKEEVKEAPAFLVPKAPSKKSKKDIQSQPVRISEPVIEKPAQTEKIPSIKELTQKLKAQEQLLEDLETSCVREQQTLAYRLDKLEKICLELNKRAIKLEERNTTLEQEVAHLKKRDIKQQSKVSTKQLKRKVSSSSSDLSLESVSSSEEERQAKRLKQKLSSNMKRATRDSDSSSD